MCLPSLSLLCRVLTCSACHWLCLASPQAKRLEELDSLYRDEAIMRKKIFNQVRAGGAEQHLCASDSWGAA